MASIVSWLLFGLGVLHIVFGLLRYRSPLTEAVRAGVVGQFQTPEVRRTAFWFLMIGPLLMLAGQVCIHAVATGDLALLRLVGCYALATALLGVAAFPRSPFWALVLLSPLLLAAGYGVG